MIERVVALAPIRSQLFCKCSHTFSLFFSLSQASGPAEPAGPAETASQKTHCSFPKCSVLLKLHIDSQIVTCPRVSIVSYWSHIALMMVFSEGFKREEPSAEVRPSSCPEDTATGETVECCGLEVSNTAVDAYRDEMFSKGHALRSSRASPCDRKGRQNRVFHVSANL